MINKENIQNIDIKRVGKDIVINIKSPTDKQAKALVEEITEDLVMKEKKK